MGQLHFVTSNMPGAPAVSTTADVGSFVAALDAALVNGFNSGVCTLTRSGSTVTVTRSGHGFVNRQMVEISGAAEAAYNGKFRVALVSASAVTFELPAGSTPASPATGSPVCKTASLGWGVAFTATNKRAYRPAAGPRDYLQVDDTQAGNTALLRAYTNMTDVDTGTGAYPNVADATTCRIIRPRSSSNTAPQLVNAAWTVVGDEKRMFLVVHRETHLIGQAASPLYSYSMFFGAFRSYALSETWNSILFGPRINTPDSSFSIFNTFLQLGGTGLAQSLASSQSFSNFYNGPFAARSFDGVSASKILQVSQHNFGTSATVWSPVAEASNINGPLQVGVGSSPIHGGYVVFGATIELVEYLNQSDYNGYALRGKFPCLQLAPNTTADSSQSSNIATLSNTWQNKTHPAVPNYGELYTCMHGGISAPGLLAWPLADMDTL